MKRVLSTLLGLTFFPFGATLVFTGTLWVYAAARVLAEPGLSGEASAMAVGRLLFGLLLAGIGFGIAGKGAARLRLAWIGEAVRAPEPAAVAGPQPELPPELTLTHAGQDVRLTAVDGDIVLGRGSDCRIVVNSKYVSRHHARIEWDAHGSLRLVNLGQSGTSVRNTGESAYRRCDPLLRVAGEGDIALFANGAEAQSRGDLVHFVLTVPARAAPASPVPSAPAPVSKATSRLVMAAIAVALLVGVVVFDSSTRKAAESERAEMKTAVDAVRHTADMALKGTSAPGNTATAAKGDAGKFEAVMKSVINRGVVQRREYEGELEAIGWTKILDPARISKDANLAESKAMLVKAHAIIARRRDGIEAHYAQMRRDVESADIAPELKRAVLKGMDGAQPAQKAQAAELWGLEDQGVAQFDRMFALLEARRATWKVRDGKIVFGTKSDLDKFNACLADLEKITARQDAIRKSAGERAQASFAAAKK